MGVAAVAFVAIAVAIEEEKKTPSVRLESLSQKIHRIIQRARALEQADSVESGTDTGAPPNLGDAYADYLRTTAIYGR